MLSESQIHFFNTNGFLVVEPELVFSAKEIGRLKKYLVKNFIVIWRVKTIISK